MGGILRSLQPAIRSLKAVLAVKRFIESTATITRSDSTTARCKPASDAVRVAKPVLICHMGTPGMTKGKSNTNTPVNGKSQNNLLIRKESCIFEMAVKKSTNTAAIESTEYDPSVDDITTKLIIATILMRMSTFRSGEFILAAPKNSSSTPLIQPPQAKL
jgi:hypothetical protein